MSKEFRISVLALCTFFLLPVQAQEMLDYPLDTINGEEVYKYEVEKSIGLYRIGVNFNVSQSEIIRFNPQLRERGLHYGETLYLPTGRKVEPKSATPAEENPATPDKPQAEPVETVETVVTVDTAAIQESATAAVAIAADSISPDSVAAKPRKVIELALMLPFESQQAKRSGNAERMMEFYQGALMALHNLQNDSTVYRLRVYDTERSERKVKALCDSTELDSVRAVLGLVYPIQIARMATWCDEHQVPLLLPFSDDADLQKHPYILQFNSTDIQEADSMCQWMLSKDSTAHFIAVDVREQDIASSIRTLRERMETHGISYTRIGMRELMTDSCAYALDTAKENVFVLHSDRLQHVRMLFPHLAKLQSDGYRIRIVSQYSWQKEESGLPQVYTSVFKSENELEAYEALWSQLYRVNHESEFPRYDLLGYDLMHALTGRLQGEQAYSGLQSSIKWTQMGNGGYQNACVQVIEH